MSCTGSLVEMVGMVVVVAVVAGRGGEYDGGGDYAGVGGRSRGVRAIVLVGGASAVVVVMGWRR